MNLLSIQSHVAYGHVGNAAAVFPLQRIGIEVWPVHTVQFSNHTGYGEWTGRVFEAGLIREVVAGIAKRGVLGECNGVLSGYIGSAEIGAAILEAVEAVRRANPAARYCCDPVIGDVGRGVFVREGVAEFFRAAAVPAADVITPNHFELDQLTGGETRTLDEVCAAIDRLHALGPAVVMVTSLQADDTPADCVDLLASDARGRCRVRTPKLPITVNGAGDAIAALFFAHYMRGEAVAAAVSLAASAIYGVLERTAEAGSRELVLVAAQEEFVKPSRLFEAQSLGAGRGKSRA